MTDCGVRFDSWLMILHPQLYTQGCLWLSLLHFSQLPSEHVEGKWIQCLMPMSDWMCIWLKLDYAMRKGIYIEKDYITQVCQTKPSRGLNLVTQTMLKLDCGSSICWYASIFEYPSGGEFWVGSPWVHNSDHCVECHQIQRFQDLGGNRCCQEWER